jgi:hypothetical protein
LKRQSEAKPQIFNFQSSVFNSGLSGLGFNSPSSQQATGNLTQERLKCEKKLCIIPKPLHRIKYLIQLFRLVPFNLRVGTKPGELALGKTTGISF